MNTAAIREQLEFLTLFFSLPGPDFYRLVADGETPLGPFAVNGSQDQFAEEMMVAATALFVNARDPRPAYPLASEFIESQAENDAYLKRLGETYRASGKIPVGYPAEHLKVQYEFLLHLLGEGDSERAGAFHREFIENWTPAFAAAIMRRNPPDMFVRMAQLIEQVNTHISQPAE